MTLKPLYLIVQRVSEASEADYQSCSIEISDIYIYVGMLGKAFTVPVFFN